MLCGINGDNGHVGSKGKNFVASDEYMPQNLNDNHQEDKDKPKKTPTKVTSTMTRTNTRKVGHPIKTTMRTIDIIYIKIIIGMNCNGILNMLMEMWKVRVKNW